ncbi:hypothetical protein T4E_11929 [Trichinella pseudospiralis]|uniref:Uncharacterized protein n=1 Tax=Trichinella pseudospiralis TaxID=6337 RepID=A0A0V1FVN7_TRIPS|nr:hypothetical protein T4E_11929 [Trichinella pseudospiralis]KRY89347.1 hypothetical protein T4D_8074 [Trichinella pseudospiralis]
MERVEMEEIELSKIQNQNHNCNGKPKEQASNGTELSQWTTPLAAYILSRCSIDRIANSFHSQIMK